MQVDRGHDSPRRQVALGLLALVGGAVVVGAVLSLVALGASQLLLGGGDREPAAEPSVFIPSRSADASAPSQQPEDPPSPTESSQPAPQRERAITLEAGVRRVPPMGRIDLSGEYRGGNGATLQVQRREGGWVDFPVQATVDGGTFSTYVQTGRTGVNRFRVVDEASGRTSNPVTVTVG